MQQGEESWADEPLGSIDGADLARRIEGLRPGPTIRLKQGRVTSALALADTAVARPVRFDDVVFEGPVDLSNARLATMRFNDCVLQGGLLANGVTVRGDLDLGGSVVNGRLSTSASVRRVAAVWLCEASIDGRLLGVGLRLEPTHDDDGPPTRALQGDRIRVLGNVRLIDGFESTGEIRLIGARIGGSLDLTDCTIRDRLVALDLAEARIGGSLFVVPGPNGGRSTIEGAVELTNASIEGRVAIERAHLKGPPTDPSDPVTPSYYRPYQPDQPVALRANGATVGGEFALVGSSISGSVEITRVRIEGRADLTSSVIHVVRGFALDARGGEFGGNLTLPARSRSIRLTNAHIRGSMLGNLSSVTASPVGHERQHQWSRIDNAEFEHALHGRGLRVDGDVYLNEARIEGGAIDLRLAQVLGDVGLRQATISNPGGHTVALSAADIGGTLYLGDGFASAGSVRLSRARIGGRLVCGGGSFTADRSSGRPAIEALHLSAESGMALGWALDGRADFTGARTSTLDDNPQGWGDDYSVAGLHYSAFGPGMADPEERLQWLLGQRPFDGASLDALADYYRRHGREADAELVVIERNRAVRRQARSDGRWRFRALADLFWDAAVGYGYRTWRAGAFLLALVALVGGLLLAPAADDVLRATDESNRVYAPSGPIATESDDAGSATEGTCGRGRVRCFNAVFYAVDTVVPLVDLHQRSTWRVDTDAPYGEAYEWTLNLATLLGWAASSTLVLGLTRTVDPRS
ncbi:MAG: hypothetical protein AAGD35_21005 [Actinomycetota bacterium]